MRVAIVGAGALGSVYGARLARVGCNVEVVARDLDGTSAAPPRRGRNLDGTSAALPRRGQDLGAIRLERIDGGGEALTWTPERVDRISSAAEVILVCVRYEQLDAAGIAVAERSAPAVVLTPMMPQDHSRLSALAPGRIVAAMPSVVSYRNEAGTIRYWLPRSAATLVEQRSSTDAESRLVAELERADIPARLETQVLARNVATTVSFIPLAMAIDAAGGIDAALEDDALLALAFDACDEGRELGREVGKAEAWATMLLRFVGPRVLKVGIGLAQTRAPEALLYVEHHFGRKLHAQNVAMGARIVELAKEKGTRFAALERLLDRLTNAGKA